MTQTQADPSLPLVILVPAYNDWESLRLLLPKIDTALKGLGAAAEMLVIDDGSIDPQPTGAELALTHLSRVRVLEMRRNLGHQRAICVGLSYVSENIPCSGVVVMDADGEDDPVDLPKLIGRFKQENGRKVVFAGRARRSESAAFRIFYAAYKLAHFILTGHRVEVGNFSVVPAMQLQRLVVVSELWNHFAAAVYSARIPYVIVPTARGLPPGGTIEDELRGPGDARPEPPSRSSANASACACSSRCRLPEHDDLPAPSRRSSASASPAAWRFPAGRPTPPGSS